MIDLRPKNQEDMKKAIAKAQNQNAPCKECKVRARQNGSSRCTKCARIKITASVSQMRIREKLNK